MGLKEPGKREIANSKPIGMYDVKKSKNGPWQAQSNTSKKSRRLMVDP